MKRKFVLVFMVVVALALVVPVAGLAQAPEQGKNYQDNPTSYGVTNTYTASPYRAPIISVYNFWNIDDVYTFKVTATAATMIGVAVTDGGIPGDWWRANIVKFVGANPQVAVSTHSTQITGWLPAADDPAWSPLAIVSNSTPTTMTAIITITAANGLPGGLSAGINVKFVTSGSALTITNIPQAGVGQRYAVLICGDTPYTAYKAYAEGKGAWAGSGKASLERTATDEGSAEYGAGFDEFWSDTVRMYNILVNKCGFAPGNVIVLWGDGIDWSTTHRADCGVNYDTTGSPIVDYSATVANVTNQLVWLKNNMTTNDSLFVWTFDHGATGAGVDGAQTGDSLICFMDGNMTDVAFAALLNAIPYKQRSIFMQQCYCGGFIDNLTAGTHGTKTAMFAACKGNQLAYRADNINPDGGDAAENEATVNYLGNPVTAAHGEFNYHFMNALLWKTPYGTAISADSNPASAGSTGDSLVPSYEAFLWAKNHESNAAQTPQFKDNGKIGWSWIVTVK